MSPARDLATSLNLNGAHAVGLAVLLALVGLPTLIGGETAFAAGRYDRIAIADGEWWRLLSGHFVHFDRLHAAANLAGTVLVWALVGGRLRVLQWQMLLLPMAGGISAALWWGSPMITWYVGASGLLHGLLACGLLIGAFAHDRLAWLALAIMAGKLGVEQLRGAMPFAETLPVVTAAHLYGALLGLVAGLAWVLRAHRYNPGPR